MKAKLRGTTGAYFDVVEVNAILVKDSIPFVRYYADEEGTIYGEYVLEFLPEESKEVTIEGWVARDANPHSLYMYVHKPNRLSDIWAACSPMLQLDPTFFPEVTWKSEPKRVKLTITPIEE